MSTANEAYRAARERIDRQLNQINHLLRAHAEKQAKNRGNWGYAGDLDHVLKALNEDVVGFLGGTKETTT